MAYFAREKIKYNVDPEYLLLPPPDFQTDLGSGPNSKTADYTFDYTNSNSKHTDSEYMGGNSQHQYSKYNDQHKQFTKYDKFSQQNTPLDQAEKQIKHMKQELKKLERERNEIQARILERERQLVRDQEIRGKPNDTEFTLQMFNQFNEMQEQWDNQNISQTHVETQSGIRKNFCRKLRQMPIFSGENLQKLIEFIQVGDLLFDDCQNHEEVDEFYFQVRYSLRGEARETLRYVTNDWTQIQHKLKEQFAHLMNRDIINSKLENLHQERKESIQQFADRTRKALIEKYNAYEDISKDQREDYNRIAKKAFVCGIGDREIRDRLSTRGANSLENAISSALEMESDARYEISDSELFCMPCERNGHRQQNCKQNKRPNDIFERLTNAFDLSTDRHNSNDHSEPMVPYDTHSNRGHNDTDQKWNKDDHKNHQSERRNQSVFVQYMAKPFTQQKYPEN